MEKNIPKEFLKAIEVITKYVDNVNKKQKDKNNNY